MVVALALTFVGYAPAHLARGICSGSGRFTEYAVIMGSDGIVRIVLCVVLAIIGVTAVGAYGLAIAVSPLFAVAYVYRRGGLQTDPGPPADWNEVTPNLGWLLLGSIFAATSAQRRPDRGECARQRERGRPRHGVLLRRAARPDPAVPVPGRAGRTPAPAQPPGRPWRDRGVPRRSPASDRRGDRRRGRRHRRLVAARLLGDRPRLRGGPERAHAWRCWR